MAVRTQQEIVERIESLRPGDLFGFQTSDLICYLDYENALPYIGQEVTAEQWPAEIWERDSIVELMLDYMPFAWEKANNCRGLSALRSIGHFTSWIWLAGDDLGDLSNYQFYGKDELRKICQYYGWDADQWDDGVRTND